MDYLKLLKAYMQHVRDEEGTDLLGCANWTQFRDHFPTLNDAELQHLIEVVAGE